MSFNKRIKIKKLLENDLIGQEAVLMGWVRTKRSNKNVTFISINDGSTISNYQVVADPAFISEEILKKVTTGACIKIIGKIVASQGAGQQAELAASSLEILGEADAETYPLQPKKHSLEFLREIAHLRIRTNTFGAVFRVRHALAFAVHKYFNDKGFFYFNSPILTASDAEGAGETFRVTTLNLNKIPFNDEGTVDFKKDFFEKETNLTVSGQLEGELAALALSEIYTFGPTFRAENSNTTRHLAEFWMVEPEMAFYDLHDNMDLAEEMLKYLVNYALIHCEDDLAFLEKREQEEQATKPQNERHELSLIARLRFVLANDFERISPELKFSYGWDNLIKLWIKNLQIVPDSYWAHFLYALFNIPNDKDKYNILFISHWHNFHDH